MGGVKLEGLKDPPPPDLGSGNGLGESSPHGEEQRSDGVVSESR